MRPSTTTCAVTSSGFSSGNGNRRLLEESDVPLVLGLDEFDRVLAEPHLANDFCGLLRAWNEASRAGDFSSEQWQKLRLVIVHSTEIYGALDIKQSPLNVGNTVDLPEFNEAQIQELAALYGLTGSPVTAIQQVVGGHPYLLRKAFYHLRCQDFSLDQLLAEAPTDASIYSDHLGRHLLNVQRNPALAAALRQVIKKSTPTQIDSIVAFQLNSMGLIEQIRQEKRQATIALRQAEAEKKQATAAVEQARQERQSLEEKAQQLVQARQEAGIILQATQAKVNATESKAAWLDRQASFDALVFAITSGDQLLNLARNKANIKPEVQKRLAPKLNTIELQSKAALNQALVDVRERQRLDRHQGSVSSVSFSPDGQTLASGSWDNTVKLWRFDLPYLVQAGCNWLAGYLATHQDQEPELVRICQKYGE